MIRSPSAVSFQHQAETDCHGRNMHFRTQVPEQEVANLAIVQRSRNKEIDQVAFQVALVLQSLNELQEV